MKFITKLQAIDPVDGELKTWMGPLIEADSFEDADRYCQENGLGYCVVDGIFEGEVPWSIAMFASRLFDDSINN